MINWATLGLNTVISLFLSLIMFALGIRAGKERTERLKLREKYRSLTIHFEEILKGLKNNKPKNWDDYEFIRDKEHGQHYPPVLKLIKTGEHLELNSKIIEDAREVEKNSLKYGFDLHQINLRIESSFLENLTNSGVELLKEYDTMMTRKNEMGKPYRVCTYPYQSLIFKNEFDEVVEKVRSKTAGISFNIVRDHSSMGGDGTHTIYIHQEDLEKIDLEAVLLKTHEKAKQLASNLLSEKDVLINENKNIIEKLSKKTKEPYSFWETVLNSIKDLFR